MSNLIVNIVNTFALPTVIIALMYFFITKPNRNKVLEQSRLMSSLSVGDMILTKEGIKGRIKKINKETCVVISGKRVCTEFIIPGIKIVSVVK